MKAYIITAVSPVRPSAERLTISFTQLVIYNKQLDFFSVEIIIAHEEVRGHVNISFYFQWVVRGFPVRCRWCTRSYIKCKVFSLQGY